MSSRRDGQGMTLLEAVVALAVLAVLVSGAVAAGADAWGDREASRAAHALAGDVRLLHAQAVTRRATLGLRLERAGGPSGWSVSVVEDGDGDGIRADDLRRGVDAVTDGPHDFAARYGAGAPGFHPGLERLRSPPPVEADLGRLEDPVRLGSSDVVTCNARGTITSGTVYLTDGRDRQFALVIYGTTGRLRVWEHDLPTRTWRLR